MKQLLEFLVQNLVDEPDAVIIDVKENDRFIDCLIAVPEAEFGKLIGRNGRVATAIRTVARAMGKKSNRKVNIKISKIETTAPLGE